MSNRTQDEILARFLDVADEDMFGFAREVLAAAMDEATIRKAFPDINLPLAAPAEPDTSAAAQRYLAFAIGKIVDHRGISASRSVTKLTEYAWLLGRDDVVKAMDGADYAQYGAPKVRAFAEGMGWPFADPAGPSYREAPYREALERMSQGEPCRDGCDEGCGR
jgi:hypothetical protein